MTSILGIGYDRIPRAVETIMRGIDEGLHYGAIVYVSHDQKVVAEIGIGKRGPESDATPLSPKSMMPWYSATKPLVVIAAARLKEAGRLDYDKRVCEYIPAFSQAEKQEITLRHLLTHTSGIAGVKIDPLEMNWDDIISAICAAPVQEDWVPGEKAGYVGYATWYILGEIVARITGEPICQYVRKSILEPAGMSDAFMGMTKEQVLAYSAQISPIYTMERNARAGEPRDDPKLLQCCIPGAGAIGTAGALGRMYEMLLNGGVSAAEDRAGAGGVRLLKEATVKELVTRKRVGMYDETFRHRMDWGLGFIINSARYGLETVPYGFGRYASDETFGHGGLQVCTSYADPREQLVVAAVFNGMPGEARHSKRVKEFSSALYKDLGKAENSSG
jgi:CubicO group peptidase (beta-lactamase class C family)